MFVSVQLFIAYTRIGLKQVGSFVCLTWSHASAPLLRIVILEMIPLFIGVTEISKSL